MTTILQQIIRFRNPHFSFDRSVKTSWLVSLFLEKAFCLLRGISMLFRGKRPKFISLAKGVKVKYISNISWGKWVMLHSNVYLSGLGKGQLKLGNNVSIGAFSRLIISTTFNRLGAFITIGDNVGIGEFAYLGGAGGLTIEEDCIIGQYFSCHPENHCFSDTTKPIRLQGVTRKGIHISKNCWIGAKVTFLDGAFLGEGSVVAAGSVVRGSFPPGSIIGGVPARVLKRRAF